MKRPIIFLMTFMFLLPCYSQEVVAADSEDMEAFDQALEETEGSERNSDSFGAFVSSEAQKLKDADLETRKAFGATVSAKVRKDQEHRPEIDVMKGRSARDEAVRNLPSHIRDKVPAQSGGGTGGRPGMN